LYRVWFWYSLGWCDFWGS